MDSAPHRPRGRKGKRRGRTIVQGILNRIPRSSGAAGGFPERIRTNLRYTDIVSLAATTTATGVVYGSNCLYDPYLAVGGHPPANFDNWVRLYGFYTGIAMRAKMRYFNSTTSSANPAAWGMSLSSDGSLVSTYPSFLSLSEQPKNRTQFSRITAGIINGPIAPPLNLGSTVAEWVGGDEDMVLTQSTYRGTSASNPGTIAPYLEVWQASVTGSSTGANTYLVEIDFDVVWSNPLPTLPS
jgi:hypothetical protein